MNPSDPARATSTGRTSGAASAMAGDIADGTPDIGAAPGSSDPALPGPTDPVTAALRPPRGIDDIVAAAREGRERVRAEDLPSLLDHGAWLIDLRTPWTRDVEGHVPGGVVIEPTVFLWRLDPLSGSRLPDGPGYDDLVITMCNEGYSSSLAARDLRELGFARATDLEGGFRAWAEAGLPVRADPTRYVT